MVNYGEVGKKVENVWDKISLKGCKWSSLNAKGSESPWPLGIIHFLGCPPDPFLFVARPRSPESAACLGAKMRFF